MIDRPAPQLRPHRACDRAGFVALLTDPRVGRYLSHAIPDGAALEALWCGARRAAAPGQAELFAIAEQASDRYLGIAYIDPAAGPGEAELGLALCREAWGLGLGVAIAAALTSTLWSRGARAVVAHVAPANQRAVRMVEKLGMRRELRVDARFDRYALRTPPSHRAVEGGVRVDQFWQAAAAGDGPEEIRHGRRIGRTA